MKILLLTTALASLVAVAPLHAQTESGSGSSTDTTTTGTTDTGTTTDTTTTGTGTDTDVTTGTDTTTDTDATVGTDTTTDTMTATVTPPEGYTQFETTALTAEELRGATIYDANGESVGEIGDFIFDSATSSAAAGTDVTAGIDPDAADGATGTTTDTMADTTADTDVDAADGSADVVADGSVSTEAGTGMDEGQVVDTEGKITHVVLDVGGFLGIGAHTVAVPLEALQVFRDGSNDLRVYLPWTQEQLEGLPEFDADDPATFSTDGMGATDGTTGGATGTTSDTDSTTMGTDDGTTGTESGTDTDTDATTNP